MLSCKCYWSTWHYPFNFKAMMDPEKVIALIAAPKDISIKLASLIFPTIPKPNAGLRKQISLQKQQLTQQDCETSN